MKTYKKIRIIGRGGFGVVDEVEDDDGKRFARKTFSPAMIITAAESDQLCRRFQREVITQQELGGTEILPVLDRDLGGTNPWFVMPLAEKTYQEKIDENLAKGLVDVEPIADIMNGLQRLHDHGYVHRDLNPNNILLSEGVWKLSDLGAVLPPSGQTVTLTSDTVIYTEQYCAPEQRLDFHKAQASADIYSLGCILHDLFGKTSRTPYRQHIAPGAMGVIIEKCTHHNPAKRPTIDRLRTLVLDTLLEEGGHCAVEDQQAGEWLVKIESIDSWSDNDFDEFGRFFAGLDMSERTAGYQSSWVYSMSTPFMTRLSTEAIQKIVARKDGVSAAIVERYCEWVRKTRFLFNFADNICSRLLAIFKTGTPSDKEVAFATLISLAESHNRWYIMRRMLELGDALIISPDLAKRLAIGIKIEGLENMFARCVQGVNYDAKTLSPALAAFCPWL